MSRTAAILCTYDGESYLPAQLDSFDSQTYSNWIVHASDDSRGSGTRAILEQYRQKWGPARMSIWRGPQKGFAANFLSLACNPSIDADIYFFSDQDDIWKPAKIDRAARWLASIPDDVPALYCSDAADRRTRQLPRILPALQTSALFCERASPERRWRQHHGVQQGRQRPACKTGPHTQIVAHDWWTYLLVSLRRHVHYDGCPSILYRQHGGNLIGANKSARARLYRLNMLLKGHLKAWNDTHIEALMPHQSMMPPENRAKLNCFSQARNRSFFPRVWGVLGSGIYRQTVMGNIGLAAAALFNRI